MAAASGVTLLLSGLLAASAPDDSVVLLALALALLGLGWNFGLVSGTAIVTDAVPLETRARTQGLVDVSIAIAGTGAGLMSGVVVDVSSYSALSFAGGLLALAIVPAIALTARSRGPLVPGLTTGRRRGRRRRPQQRDAVGVLRRREQHRRAGRGARLRRTRMTGRGYPRRCA